MSPAAVAATTRVVQADLDAAPNAIHALLSQVASAGQATSGELSVTFGGETLPIDWWLYAHGLITLTGSDAGGQPVFQLSKAGMALLGRPPAWLTASPTLDPASECKSEGSLTAVRCEVKAIYAVTPTADGRGLMGFGPPPPLTVTDSVSSDGKQWTADAADYGQGEAGGAAALKALLGPAETWNNARQTFATQIAARSQGDGSDAARQPGPSSRPAAARTAADAAQAEADKLPY